MDDKNSVNQSQKHSSGESELSPRPALECSCWFNKLGELIYVEWACPIHGKDAYDY